MKKVVLLLSLMMIPCIVLNAQDSKLRVTLFYQTADEPDENHDYIPTLRSYVEREIRSLHYLDIVENDQQWGFGFVIDRDDISIVTGHTVGYYYQIIALGKNIDSPAPELPMGHLYITQVSTVVKMDNNIEDFAKMAAVWIDVSFMQAIEDLTGSSFR